MIPKNITKINTRPPTVFINQYATVPITLPKAPISAKMSDTPGVPTPAVSSKLSSIQPVSATSVAAPWEIPTRAIAKDITPSVTPAKNLLNVLDMLMIKCYIE